MYMFDTVADASVSILIYTGKLHLKCVPTTKNLGKNLTTWLDKTKRYFIKDSKAHYLKLDINYTNLFLTK